MSASNLTAAAIREKWPDCEIDQDHVRILVSAKPFGLFYLHLARLHGERRAAQLVGHIKGGTHTPRLPLWPVSTLDQLTNLVAVLRGERGV